MITQKGVRYAFFVGLHTQSQEKIVKKPQILGSVTIFSYICSRIHKECGK